MTPEAQREETGSLAPESVDAQIEANRVEYPALAAVQDIRRWLGVRFIDVARIAGWESASTIQHWRSSLRDPSRQAPVRPRAATVARLYRVHAMLRAIAEAVEGPEGTRGVYMWARTVGGRGNTPLDLLLKGSLSEVERDAASLLFNAGSSNTLVWQRYVDDRDEFGQTTPDDSEITRIISAGFEAGGSGVGFE